MGRSASRAAELGLVAVSIEGGLIAPEQVQKILATDRSAKVAESYACPKGTMLADEIVRYFRIGQAIWRDYDRVDSKTITRTAAFARDLLAQCFGFTDLVGPVEHCEGGRRFRLAWEAKGGRIPVVVAASVPGADAFVKALVEFGDGDGGRPRRSPTALLQDWLNTADHALWGLVFAGDRLRLMRDNASLTRPAWIEADLGRIFAEEAPYADFIAIWLLAHASRFGSDGATPSDCPLEQWREEGLKQGVEARADLRNNVEAALMELGQGLVEANPDLVRRLQFDNLALSDLFEELLLTIYRLIFLAVAEDRDLLHPRRLPQSVRSLFESNYSFNFWRKRSRRRVARDAHYDAWEAMKITLSALDLGEELLGLPALGGLFATVSTPALNAAKIPNVRFLAAIYYLGFIVKDGVTHRINWRDLKTEELGSVYEGLLEIRPRLEANGTFKLDTGAKGNARKISGSYYTPDSLVECLLDTALDPVLDTAEAAGITAEEKVTAILELNVIDPACGSGHFLLGAARRMATRVARLRNEDAGKDDFQAALRDVIARCIHGVDRNPMAVELAKVALWIESVSPGAPLGFLDGNIRCGDALLGVFDLAALDEGIPDEAYKPLTGDDKGTANGLKRLNKAEREGGLLQRAFDPAPLSAAFRKFHRMPETTPREVAARAAEFERIRRTPEWIALQQACDIFVSAFLLPKSTLVGLNERPLVPTTADVRRVLASGAALSTGAIPDELAAAVGGVSIAARAFHWPLEFADAIVGKGGFDVVLGNPPWERIKLQEQEFFAGTDIAEAPNAAARGRLIREWGAEERGSPRRMMIDAFETAKRVAEASSVFCTAPKDADPTKIPLEKVSKARRYPWTGRGDVNTYALFAEHFLNLTREGGRSGVIVPTGIATDATTAPFFGHLISSRRLASIFSFFEVRKWFAGTDDRRDFCLLTFCSNGSVAEFASLLTNINQLLDPEMRFPITPAEIEKINPNTKTSPLFRTRKDKAITINIYNLVPILLSKIHGYSNPWKFLFMSMFHMSNDSALFRTARQLTEAGFIREGTDWVRKVNLQQPMKEVMAEAAAKNTLDLLSGLLPERPRQLPPDGALERYVPLFEAKMMQQYDHRFGDGSRLSERPQNSGWPRPSESQLQEVCFEADSWYWVPEHAVESRYRERRWERLWSINWRRSARSGDERTLIASIAPHWGIGDNLFTILVFDNPRRMAAFVGCLNSLIVDYCLRQKAGGANMSYFLIEQLPILPPHAYNEAALAYIVPRVLELTYTTHAMAPFARDLGYEGPPFAWSEDRRASLRAELDAWYALAYGLSRDELRYILDPKDLMGPDYPSETFRVLQNNDRARYREYRTQCLVLAAYDMLTMQGARARSEGY